MMQSLRSRMQVGMLVGIAVSLAIFAGGTYAMIRRTLIGEFDASLTAETHTLAASVNRDGREINIPPEIEAIPEFRQSASPNYFQFWADGREVLLRSPSLGSRDLDPFGEQGDEPAIRAVTLPSGRPGRSAGIRFMPVAKKKRHKPPAVLPQAAAKRIADVFTGAEVRKVDFDNGSEGGLYRVRFRKGDRNGEVRITADGTIVESTVPATQRDLPQRVLDAAAALLPGAAIDDVRVTTVRVRIMGGGLTPLNQPRIAYDIMLIGEDKKLEAEIAADGTVIEMEQVIDDNDDDRDGEQKPRPSTRPATPKAVTLVVARDASDLEARLRSLRWVLAGACAAAMAVALLVTAGLVRRGLKPLSLLAARIGEIREDDLTDRIPTGPMPTELQPVRQRLNKLLERLQKAFKRERRFTADATHELKTPLAGLRSTIEVAVSRDRPAGEYKQSLAECLSIAKHIQSTTEYLLMLSRLDAQQVTLRSEPVALAGLIDWSWQGLADNPRQRSLTYRSDVPPDAVCLGDREYLGMIFSNLLGNARDYTDEGGAIDITARSDHRKVEITLANTGCQLTAEQVTHVFDRFWQGDEARSSTGVHSGLGLSLVQRITSALGGSISASVDADGLFTVKLSLPAAAKDV